MRFTQKAAPENGVGAAVQNRLQKPRKLVRVVLEISVLNYDDVACRVLDPGGDRRALSAVRVVKNEDVYLTSVAQRLEHGSRAIA